MGEQCKCRSGKVWHPQGEVGWCMYVDFVPFLDHLKEQGITDPKDQYQMMVHEYGHPLDWLWEKVPTDFVAGYLSTIWRVRSTDDDRTELYDAPAGLWRTPEDAARTFVGRRTGQAIFGSHAVAEQMNREGL